MQIITGGKGEQAKMGIPETTMATFRADVLTASMQQPVLVDFWAPWCAPCKQLAPALERAVAATRGKVIVYKLNIDAEPQISQQLGIQSIPAVIAFQKGQPVDGFMGALPESQIVAFLERLIGPISNESDVVTKAEALLAEGKAEETRVLLEPLVQKSPDNAQATATLLMALIALGETGKALFIFNQLPQNLQSDPQFARVVAALDLAAKAASLPGVDSLRQNLNANPNDLQTRYDLALALNAHGDRAQAADELLEIIKRDRTWNDDGARKQLLHLFDAWGAMDPAVKSARRKLSGMLFA